MLAFIYIAMFVAGLFMFLLPQMGANMKRLGELLLLSVFLSLAITVAPAAVKLLHS